MKKMLLIFLILFTKVLADSDEDKYLDLLPDEEKQDFLDRVARRILKDVESQENVTNAKSGEVPDENLNQHTEFVKSILKDEQKNARSNKDDGNENESKSSSEEKGVLGVQSLGTGKTAVQDDKTSDESAVNNITAEAVTDDTPKIKRSVEDNDASQSVESGEVTSTTPQTNITSEETNEIEAENENLANGNDTSVTKDSSEKGSDVTESTTVKDENFEVVSVKDNEDYDKLNVSVKSIHETRRKNDEDGKLTENTTEMETTTSAVEVTTSVENKSDEYKTISSGSEGEFTTITYPFESSSLTNKTTESTIVDDILLESTTEIPTTEKASESLVKSKNVTSKDSENDVQTKSTRTSTTNEETTVPVPETTESTSVTIESTEASTESTPGTTESIPDTTEPVLETTLPATDTPKPVTETTKLVPETTSDSKTTTTEEVTEPTTVLVTTESIPVATTEEMNIVLEDFTSAPTIVTNVKTTTPKPTKKRKAKKAVIKESSESSEEVTTVAGSEEESVEATTKKTHKRKIVVHKPVKIGPTIVGPKGKKMAEAKTNSNLIDLEKYYYDNNYKVKTGKEYVVYEIPAGQPPFDKQEEPVAVDEQPYYVPVYNYSPNNAYFNPQNRLGPNAVDTNAENNGILNDYEENEDQTETRNAKTEYFSERKKFGSKQKNTHNIHRQPIPDLEPHGKINPEDYQDSDYYFGRVRKAFPDSDETDHPAHSIREGSLKDHVRAVRNILFQQKSFGLLERDKYGASVERAIRKGRERHEEKQALHEREDSKNQDRDIDREGINSNHVQKVGYVKKHNDAKELYIMDDFFKENVEKYVENQGIPPTTRIQNEDDGKDEVIAYLREEDGSESFNNVVKRGVRDSKDDTRQGDTAVYQNGEDVTENISLSLRRNDVVKVDVYLQVLKDMLTLDNKALVQYDWLGTTVDIQAALQKLFELTALVANEEDVHPSDMEILKYVLFLNKLASEIIDANDFGAQLREKLILPRNKKRKHKPRMLKEKGLINRVWLYLRKEVPEVNENQALEQLNSFLIRIEDGLYDLHDAIKNIAKITKYRNQHWYQNLKDLYINTDEKQLLELLLHFTALRVFTLIEESAQEGLEDDYIQYMKENRKKSKQTLDEMIFLMEILNEYDKYVE